MIRIKTILMSCILSGMIGLQAYDSDHYFQIVNSPYQTLNNTICLSKGTAAEIWNLEHWVQFVLPGVSTAVTTYASMLTENGLDLARFACPEEVFYTKCHDCLGYCLHKSWLKEIDQAEGEKIFNDYDRNRNVGGTVIFVSGPDDSRSIIILRNQSQRLDE